MGPVSGIAPTPAARPARRSTSRQGVGPFDVDLSLTFMEYQYREQIMNTSFIPTISAATLMERALPQTSEILGSLLASDSSALVYGPAGVGKSFFALGLAWAAAS